jgi:hypothetical protein
VAPPPAKNSIKKALAAGERGKPDDNKLAPPHPTGSITEFTPLIVLVLSLLVTKSIVTKESSRERGFLAAEF